MTADTITVTTNHWRVAKNPYSGIIEGLLSDEKRLQLIAQTKAERELWKPTAEAMELVHRLEKFICSEVQVQLWHPEMSWHELEGPFPFTAKCRGVEVRQSGEYLQAFLIIADPVELPNDMGFSPDVYFQKHGEDYLEVSLADLYEISKIGK